MAAKFLEKYMVNKSSGSIINISSASAGPPLSKAFTYSVSKAGIKNLTQNLGREWGQNGVRVNAIRPGFFPTEWNKKTLLLKKEKIKFKPYSHEKVWATIRISWSSIVVGLRCFKVCHRIRGFS